MFSPFFDIKNLLQLFKHGYFNAKSWTPSFLTRILTAIRFCALLELHPVAAIRVEFSRNQSRGKMKNFCPSYWLLASHVVKSPWIKLWTLRKCGSICSSRVPVVHETYHMQDQDTISPGFAIFFGFKIALAMRKLQGRSPFGGMCKGSGSNTDWQYSSCDCP